MPVYKRDPRVDAQYYVSGSAVRSNVRSNAQEPATRRFDSRRVTALPQNEPATRRVGTTTQRRPAQQQPLQDTRTRQERRRAEPARAYYAPYPEQQRLTRAEVNHRTVQQHAWMRAEAERRRREEEARIAAEEMAEQKRRDAQRVNAFVSALVIAGILIFGVSLFVLLYRYTLIDDMTVQQRTLQAQIADQEKRLEELQVEINKQSNIAQVQDYARENLNMDYAQQENIRTIVLPGN